MVARSPLPNCSRDRITPHRECSSADPRPETYVEVARDDLVSFGPEIIIIRRDPNTNQFVPG